MATCRSLSHIFDNTITENNSSSTSSLFNWKQIKPLKPHLDHSFTEIFGELHFKEHHSNPTSTFSSSSSSLSSLFSPSLSSLSLSSSPSYPDIANDRKNETTGYTKPYHRKSNSFSSVNSDSSLQLCTEGLGSESLGDIEDLKTDNNTNNTKDRMHVRRHSSDSTYSYCKFKRANEKAMFPPPISYIGQSGKPAVSFQSYRKDGRFVLKEVRIPTQECLQASREDGCLRLSFVQSNDDDDDDDDDDSDKGGEDDGGDEEEYEDKEEDEVEVKDDVSKE